MEDAERRGDTRPGGVTEHRRAMQAQLLRDRCDVPRIVRERVARAGIREASTADVDREGVEVARKLESDELPGHRNTRDPGHHDERAVGRSSPYSSTCRRPRSVSTKRLSPRIGVGATALPTREEPPLRVGGTRFSHERRGRSRAVALEAHRPLLELFRGRPPRTERGVDGEEQLVRERRPAPLRARGSPRAAPGRLRERPLPEGGASADVARISFASILPARRFSRVTSASATPPGVETRSGRRVPRG